MVQILRAGGRFFFFAEFFYTPIRYDNLYFQEQATVTLAAPFSDVYM